jgi:hypothetical protein
VSVFRDNERNCGMEVEAQRQVSGHVKVIDREIAGNAAQLV